MREVSTLKQRLLAARLRAFIKAGRAVLRELSADARAEPLPASRAIH
jgi:hypothetical protein